MSRTHSPRIEMLGIDASKAAAAEASIPEAFAELSVFRVLLHHPELAKAITGLLTTLLFRGSLDTRLRELVIMRIAWVTGSCYEWTQHWRVAIQLGVSEQDLLSVRDWKNAPSLGDAERAVLAATDDTLELGKVRNQTWSALEKQLGDGKELLELVACIGNWRLFSQLLQSLEIPLEDGVEAWPPDGGPSPAAG